MIRRVRVFISEWGFGERVFPWSRAVELDEMGFNAILVEYGVSAFAEGSSLRHGLGFE